MASYLAGLGQKLDRLPLHPPNYLLRITLQGSMSPTESRTTRRFRYTTIHRFTDGRAH